MRNLYPCDPENIKFIAWISHKIKWDSSCFVQIILMCWSYDYVLEKRKWVKKRWRCNSDGRTHHFCWCHLLITLGLLLEFRFFVPDRRGKVHLQYSKTVTGNSKTSCLFQVFLLMYQGTVNIQIVPANISSWSTFRRMINRLIDWLVNVHCVMSCGQ